MLLESIKIRKRGGKFNMSKIKRNKSMIPLLEEFASS